MNDEELLQKFIDTRQISLFAALISKANDNLMELYHLKGKVSYFASYGDKFNYNRYGSILFKKDDSVYILLKLKNGKFSYKKLGLFNHYEIFKKMMLRRKKNHLQNISSARKNRYN